MSDEDNAESEVEVLAPSEVDKIRNVKLDEPSPIPFSLFSKKNNRTTHLVDNTDPDRIMKGRHEWYHFKLEEPVFVSEIEIAAEGYRFAACEVQWQPLRQTEFVSRRVQFEDGKFFAAVDDIITGFSFKPDAKYFSGTKILSVDSIGFTLAELDGALAQLSDLEGARQSAVRSAKKMIDQGNLSTELVLENDHILEERKAELTTLQGTLSEQVNILETIRSEVEESKKIFADLETQQASNEARIEQQTATIEERTIERKQLSVEVSEKSAALKELESNIYLFPSEIKEFAEKAGEDKSFYWKLAAVPIAVVTMMAIALLKNAADLTTIFNETDNARLVSIFVTRAPYVAIAGAIITVMYKLSHTLVAEIMRIDNQTRSLAKISIIATDVSVASAEKLGFSDEEDYHLRTGLKMDLLREHLKSYIPQDYNYLKSDRVSSRLGGIKDKFRRDEEDAAAEAEAAAAAKAEAEAKAKAEAAGAIVDEEGDIQP